MDWDFTGDQYHVDTDSRYPLFSDINTTDHVIYNTKDSLPAVKNSTRSGQKKYARGSGSYVGSKIQLCGANGCVLAEIDINIVIIFFMFIVIIFLCVSYNRNISELKNYILHLNKAN